MVFNVEKYKISLVLLNWSGDMVLVLLFACYVHIVCKNIRYVLMAIDSAFLSCLI